ncbi:MAG: hypothetical protein WDO56_17005 [Gammaproteobacteria bacterium]
MRDERASRHPFYSITFVLFAFGSAPLYCQESPAPAQPEKQQASDKSGTNPANFSKTLQVREEYYSLKNGDLYGTQTELLYSQPLGGKWKLDFEVPFLVGTNAFGPNLYGLGDVSVTPKLRPYISRKLAVIAGVELTAPTGTRDQLSTNRWTLGPTITLAFFFPKQHLIFAPTYQDTFSLSDSSAAANFASSGGDLNEGGAPVDPDATAGDIHKGVFDLYVVYQMSGGRQWILIDPAITIDYENNSKVTASIAPAFGFFVASGSSVTAQAVIPLTNGALDWGIKLTFKQVF